MVVEGLRPLDDKKSLSRCVSSSNVSFGSKPSVGVGWYRTLQLCCRSRRWKASVEWKAIKLRNGTGWRQVSTLASLQVQLYKQATPPPPRLRRPSGALSTVAWGKQTHKPATRRPAGLRLRRRGDGHGFEELGEVELRGDEATVGDVQAGRALPRCRSSCYYL